MSNLVSTTTGLYPLPDWAKDELSDLKGHQKHDLIAGDEGDEITSVYEKVRNEFVSNQTEAGLDLIVEGQARWDDMLAHPLVVHENVDTRGIVRYYNNNNFYRDPVITGDLSPTGDIAEELNSAREYTDELQAVLPGPFTLADLASNEYYDDESTLLEAIATFLADEVMLFPKHEVLYLLEPSLVTNPPSDGPDIEASEAIDLVANATDADVVVHTYWGALPEKVHAHLLDADIQAVGYDFVSNVDNNIELIAEFGTKDNIGLGLVDGQNTLVESPKTIRERIDWIGERLPVQSFDTIYVSPNTELFYLPVSKYQAKLATLGTATSGPEVTV